MVFTASLGKTTSLYYRDTINPPNKRNKNNDDDDDDDSYLSSSGEEDYDHLFGLSMAQCTKKLLMMIIMMMPLTILRSNNNNAVTRLKNKSNKFKYIIHIVITLNFPQTNYFMSLLLLNPK